MACLSEISVMLYRQSPHRTKPKSILSQYNPDENLLTITPSTGLPNTVPDNDANVAELQWVLSTAKVLS